MSVSKSERTARSRERKPAFKIPQKSNYFGQVLKEIRVQRNLTQGDAAKLVNLSQAQWSSYEKGNSRPTLDIIISIANSFHMEPLALIGRSLDKFRFPKEPDRELSFIEYEKISRDFIEDYRNSRHEQIRLNRI